jgi:hypothetical protein
MKQSEYLDHLFEQWDREFSCYHPKSLVSLFITSKVPTWMEERKQRSDFNSVCNRPKKDTRMKLLSSSDNVWYDMNLPIMAL